ncbi:MAG: Release factor glutamine methyltransferase [Oscillospiraceae bacterium]|jgi:release factor glutamine methyltransferase
MSTLSEVYRQGRNALAAGGNEGPGFEADCLFEKVFGLNRMERILRSDQPAQKDKAEHFRTLVCQRLQGRPLQYILGEWPFCGRNFFVGEGVLIPREETELLVQTASDMLQGEEKPHILDLCSGTGAVAIALGDLFADAQIDAIEWIQAAFGYLKRNIERSGLKNVRPVRMNVLDPNSAHSFGNIDCIVSNPPYVRKDELPTLQREVQFEPREALDGGADGLIFYRATAKLWLPALRPGGVLCVEVGDGQAEQTAEIFRTAGLSGIRFARDFSGIDRVVYGYSPKQNKNICS